MSYTVYVHTTPDDKRYVGMTRQLPAIRWKNGKGYYTQYFGEAIEKYGWENIRHEILYEGLTQEEAEKKEKELIREYKSDQKEYGYNLENGGIHNTCSDETKLKISLGQKALNKTIPDWHKEILRNAQLGRKQAPETIEKRIAHYKGKKYEMGEYQKQRIREAMANMSPEKRTERAIKAAKTKKNRKYDTVKSGKRVIQKDLDGNIVKEYASISEFCRQTKHDSKNLALAVKNNRPAYGYMFEIEDSAKPKGKR